jgi:hypothetical protein
MDENHFKEMTCLNNRREALLESSKAGNFLETVYASSRSDRDERGDLDSDLAALHNEGLINIVSAFENLKNESSQGHAFFLMRDVFEKALPQLNAPVSSVMRCVLHLYREAGQDMAAGTILDGFAGFCAKEPSRPREALKEIEANPGMFVDLLVATISAGSRINNAQYLTEAIRLSEDKNIELRRGAVYAVRKLNWPEGALVPDSAFAALERSVAVETDDLILAGVVKSAFALLQRDKTQEGRSVALITNALSKGGEYTLQAASETFGFHTDQIPGSLLDVLLIHLMRVKPANKWTLEKIDYGIARLLEKSDERAICFLEDMLIPHPDELTLKTFKSAAREIRSSKLLLSKVLTRWFIRGDQVLCEGVHEIVSVLDGENLKLEIDPDELKPADVVRIVFVAKKAIGYLFFLPVSAASILISLMRCTDDDEILKVLGGLLFNPLLMNFTVTVRQYAVRQSGLESGKVKETIDNALKAIDDYLDVLRSVGTLPALHPSEAQRETHHRHFSRIMEESLKATMAQSTLLNLIPKSILLYGRKSIDYVYDDDDPPHRMETDLKGHGTEIEHPRLERIDPYDLEYMLWVFRIE